MSISDRNSSTSFLIFGKLETTSANKAAFGSATLCSNSVAIRLKASKSVATSLGVAYQRRTISVGHIKIDVMASSDLAVLNTRKPPLHIRLVCQETFELFNCH